MNIYILYVNLVYIYYTHILTNFFFISPRRKMDSRSQLWRQMKSHECDHHRRFHSETQVDLTLRLGFPNANDAGERPDIDHNNPFFNHHQVYLLLMYCFI